VISFNQFLKEEAIPKAQHLTHLEHPEDLMLDHGKQGYKHAVDALKDVNEKLTGGFNGTRITEKYDGSPSIVFGHDPKTKKFFVATKSAFNKDPKINYTDADIDKNHGHAPGLVAKLKEALLHLPKVAPKAGVFQGDLMHTRDDVHEHAGEYNFTPNTIMYSTPKNSPEGKKIKDSKIGIVVHSKYHGPSLDKMSVGFEPDLGSFKEHKDVHLISPEVEPPKSNSSTTFEHHIKRAEKEFNDAPADTLDVTKHHAAHIKTFINKSVREKSTPTTAGFRRHIMEIGEKNAAKVSTAKAKQKHMDDMLGHLKHIEEHKDHYDSLFKIHHHIQAAKNELVKSLSKTSKYEHSVDGKPVKPEGYVAVKDGHPIKLVDRSEFSFHNLTKQRK
jgi:Family of unknown function (DUF6267)